MCCGCTSLGLDPHKHCALIENRTSDGLWHGISDICLAGAPGALLHQLKFWVDVHLWGYYNPTEAFIHLIWELTIISYLCSKKINILKKPMKKAKQDMLTVKSKNNTIKKPVCSLKEVCWGYNLVIRWRQIKELTTLNRNSLLKPTLIKPKLCFFWFNTQLWRRGVENKSSSLPLAVNLQGLKKYGH